jgi:cell division septation protein DedD
MQVDIGHYIGELLYLNETVSVPGLGSFIGSYQPANIDPVQGELAPPSKSLMFDQNLVVDDGLLIQQISQDEQIPLEEAEKLVAAHVDQMKEAIDKREIITLTGLGRLYKDYEGEFQFLPDGTNYNTDSYGLPKVRFYPVSRTASTSHYNKGTGTQQESKPKGPDTGTLGLSLNKSLSIVIAGAAVVAIIAIYFLLTQKNDNQLSTGDSQTIPTARVNVKPTVDEEEVDNQPVESPQEQTYEEENIGPEIEGDPNEEEMIDTESPTLVPEQDYFVIIIGSFGNVENVERLVTRIYQAGYEPYTEKNGKLTKVGIQKTYTSRSEIQTTLKDIRRNFSKDAKVYKD